MSTLQPMPSPGIALSPSSPGRNTISLLASESNAKNVKLPPNALVLPPTTQLQALLTIIRDEKTQSTSDRIIRLLVEEGLNHLPVIPKTVRTPVGMEYDGVSFQGRICGVSIMRGYGGWVEGLLSYAKLPDDIAERYCLLLDPMLATGGSCIKAIEVLLSHGVQEERIIFLNLIASPEGTHNVCTRFPKLRMITAWIDEGLDSRSYIVPGLGDFGDRYFL
ncbi:uracil phosphoribosyltransferase [Saitozyma sp. JCM 24511]|nr:uracil phosphoribosyltransferase [Saitozyma sp. JCM 24511]